MKHESVVCQLTSQHGGGSWGSSEGHLTRVHDKTWESHLAFNSARSGIFVQYCTVFCIDKSTGRNDTNWLHSLEKIFSPNFLTNF